jgi:benzoate-CoA ligase
MKLDRTVTPYDDRIYPKDWRDWRDPEISDWIDPIAALIGRHRGTPIENKTAISADGEGISFRELESMIERYSGMLGAAGLVPESRMLMFGTDSLDYVVTWLAAVRLGAIPVVVSDLYKQDELLYFLTDVAARVLFIDGEQTEKLLAIADRLPNSLETVIVRGEPCVAWRRPRPAMQSLLRLLESPTPAPAHRRHRNDVSYMFYSGGTTGTAKGITHLAHDFVLVPQRQGAFWEYTPDDVVFATSRKYFTHGLWPGVLIPLYWGATAILDRRPPTPDVVVSNLGRFRVSKLISVPTVLKNIIEHLMKTGEQRFPALKLAVSASEKMPPEMFEHFYTLTGCEILDSIGSSEITYEWIANRPKAFKRGSLGKPVFGYEVRLIAADGNEVTEPNVAGEAWIKSATSCFYYWRKYDKSRDTFIGGWTRTGDNLYFDEDGFFWFAGRNDDFFKVKGLWVSPLEIEAVLTGHSAIREAAVVPFNDRDGLSKPRAYIVLRDGFSATPALLNELKAAVGHLGSFKIPASFIVIDVLPRTTLLKIDRRALRGK